LGGVASLLLGERAEKVSAPATGVTTDTTNTPGQVAFWDGSSDITGSNNLRWDNANRNFIGGYSGNSVTAGTVGGTISGGGTASSVNKVTDNYGTVGGGANNVAGNNNADATDATYATVGGGGGNQASASIATVSGGVANMASAIQSTVGGGFNNAASGNVATIGGGSANMATASLATIGGGGDNTASGNDATIGGGSSNTTSGNVATIPGGFSNLAAGDYSFAAGNRAKVGTTPGTHNGTFLFADSNDFDFNSAGGNEFAARATGGVRFVTAIDGSGNPTATTVIDPNGNVGIGTTSPQSHLFVVDSTTNPSRGVVASQNNTGRQAALMQMTKSRGTRTSPTAVANGDYVAAFNMNAYDGASYLGGKPMAGWGALVNGTVSTGSIPTDLFFYTKPSGTLDPYGDGVVRVVISSAGNVGIGTTNPSHLIQLSGGAYSNGSTWVNASDRNLKENFTPLDEQEILNRLESVPIQKWNYKNQPQAAHIGPVAQDFYAAYQLGDSDKSIGTIDADGIAFAAIKALHKTMKEQLKQFKNENEELQERIRLLEQTVKQLAAS
jgi:hypothetical protein